MRVVILQDYAQTVTEHSALQRLWICSRRNLETMCCFIRPAIPVQSLIPIGESTLEDMPTSWGLRYDSILSIDRPAPHVTQTFDDRVARLPILGTCEQLIHPSQVLGQRTS
jgi:hypothetical protein